MNPEHPVYIVSKGRAERGLTARSLDHYGVPYSIVVEAQERDAYAAVVDPAKIVVLDPAYQRDYDPCCRLELGKSKGSGPARNFVWDHAVARGATWHWIMDDNIHGFVRLNRNKKVPVRDGTILKCMEDFVARYSNIALAGPHYRFFIEQRSARPPFVFNSRIYSCLLIRCDVPFRWRGRYNEDTILSLDVLKAGWCTVLFTAFLQNKIASLKMPGGNTDELYKDGTLAKSRLLVNLYPDVVKLTQKYGRWHHHINYRQFSKRKLIRKPEVEIRTDIDDYGMKLVHIEEEAA